jgi:hypothetical protein
MHREMIYTAVIYAVLALLAWLSLAGILLAIGWLGVGLWMVLKTRSRGILADLSFMATWPLYVVVGK